MSASATSLDGAVRAAAELLRDAGIDSAEFDALALAAHVLGTSVAEVRKLMILGEPAPDRLQDLVSERARRVPLQHLTGKAGFRRLELSVGPGVFVPRFETELVAGLAISHLAGSSLSGRRVSGRPLGHGGHGGAVVSVVAPVVVDLCTGSGAIALAIKDEVPSAEVHAVELSDLAHAWAVRNRDNLGLEVDIRLGDATVAFPELESCVDVVVSNPPYIPVGAVPIDPEVRDHDPEIALYGGSDDGLGIPLAVARRAASLLRTGGFFVMEHADVQGVSLPTMLRATGWWRDIQDHKDLNGRPRAVSAVRCG